MRQLLSCYLLFFSFQTAFTQQDSSSSFVRFFVDNDAFVLSNNFRDWGYTSGIRLDFFYTNKAKPGFFEWFNNRFGKGTINNKSWSLMQILYAPKNTRLTIPDKNDYAYSSALFAAHTIHSAIPAKKLILRSEWLAGITGPPALGKQMQTFFHRLIKDPKPMGWDYQLPTDILLNHSVYAEKYFTGTNNYLGVAGTGRIRAGTMYDDISAGLKLTGTDFKNYFSGLSKQYFTKKIGITISMEAAVNLVLYNALLQGGIFNSKSPVHDPQSPYRTDRKFRRFTQSAELSVMILTKRIAAQFGQRIVNSELQQYDPHICGNISLYVKF